MVQKKWQDGPCHICGEHGKLTFEHVPPKSAFNDTPVTRATFEQALAALEERADKDLRGLKKGLIQQQGMGAYTLCQQCNNTTGDWYARHFADWCIQAMIILERTGGRPSLVYLNYLRPLPILKQIVTMFFSVNSERFAAANPDLVRFVLNRESQFLPPRFRFFAYYTLGMMRTVGVTAMLTLGGDTKVVSEIAAPPLGYVMTIDSGPPDPRLFEITHFCRYGYYEVVQAEIRASVLPVATPFPGDYRTPAEIAEAAAIDQPSDG